MLLEFSIENFLSFKNKVSFSMLANTTKGLENNYVELPSGKKVLKTAAIYGANASGKSNLFKILNTIKKLIKKSNNVNRELRIIPFKFSSDNKPSKFEIKFIKNDIEYVYGFSANQKCVVEEYLYYYPNGRITKIFDRTNTDDYSFNQKDTKFLNSIKEKTTSNNFFLNTATFWNYDLTKPAFEFITEDLQIFMGIDDLKYIAFNMYKEDNSKKIKDFALKFLKEADINISDYSVQEINIPEELSTMVSKIYDVTFTHIINNKEYKLNFKDESLGTQILFIILPFIANVINNKNKVLIADELDKSLHPFIVQFIVNLFNSAENKNNAQLIFNTHETNLLNLNLLRRDQIWFTEKNAQTGISDLYSLSDFSTRNKENIEKGYMLGKYGAIPDIFSNLDL